MSVAEPLTEPVIDQPSTGQWAVFVLLDCVEQSPTVVVFDSSGEAEQWCVDLISKIDPGFIAECKANLYGDAGTILTEYQDMLAGRDFLHVYPVSDPQSVGGF